MMPTLKDFLESAVSPAYVISLAIYQYILTIYDLFIIHHEPGVLFKPSKLRERAFSRFWNAYGAWMSGDLPVETMSLLKTVSGTVLDVGPGTGDQLRHFDASKIIKAYGAEPTTELHGKLKVAAGKVGLNYSILSCGGEPNSLIPGLAKAGLLQSGAEGIFDEIVCLRVLCGVPKQLETVEGLYRLLKPGGRLVVYEHVKNPWREPDGNFFSRLLQVFYMFIGWKFWIGDCNLDRDTKSIIIKAGGKGGWSKVELQCLRAWSLFPYLVGYLVKED